MAGTAISGRLTWQLAKVVELIVETARVTSLVLELAEWPGHRAGQHVDVRLTAEDGFQAQRSYSIASAPEDEHRALLERSIGAPGDRPLIYVCGPNGFVEAAASWLVEIGHDPGGSAPSASAHLAPDLRDSARP